MTRARFVRRQPVQKIQRAVLYARVSSKEQEREGFSIGSQLKLLRAYAEENGIRIAREYVDIETAKLSGRTHFNEMIAYLRSHPATDAVLVEKTDRLYRNLRDWVTIDELDLEIHFAKENIVLAPDSRSSEKFLHGIKVLMAKNYIDNLSEEVRKGMLEKAEQGIWPSIAPTGYRNVMGPHGKRVIEADPDSAPAVTRLFEWYSTGRYSLKQAAKMARSEGMTFRGSTKPISTSSVHKILRSRIYTGEFDWLGKRYRGTHEPLVSVELWERVQEVLDGRHTARVRGIENDFLFTGMIHCGHCGCLLVGDIKKQKYIYYRCSHAKRKCPEPYVREEALLEQFGEMLDRLSISEDIFQWLTHALHESFGAVRQEHDAAIWRLKIERDRLRERMKQIYIDNLDGRIEDTLFNALTAEFREQERKVSRALELRREADLSYMDEGIALMSIARGARRRFLDADLGTKKHMISGVLSNCSFRDRKISATYRKPFDILVENAAAEVGSELGKAAENGGSPKWQGRSDSNRGPSVLETDALTN